MTRQITHSAVIGLAVVFSQFAESPATEPTDAQRLAIPQKAAARQQSSADDEPVTETESRIATETAATRKAKPPKPEGGAIEVVQPKFSILLSQGFSKVIRTKQPVIRVAVPSREVVDVVAFQPTEVGLMGKSPGVTTVTLWIGTKEKSEPVQILVRVQKNGARRNRIR